MRYNQRRQPGHGTTLLLANARGGAWWEAAFLTPPFFFGYFFLAIDRRNVRPTGGVRWGGDGLSRSLERGPRSLFCILKVLSEGMGI